jgi:hypothetical protein
MKILFQMLSDGSLVHEAMAELQMQQYNQVRVGMELTADRVMLLGMPSIGQLSKTCSRSWLEVQRKNQHPPLLRRLFLLDEFRQKTNASDV